MEKTLNLLKIIMRIQKKWRLGVVILCSFTISFIQIYIGDSARRMIDHKILDENILRVASLFILMAVIGTIITYIMIILRSSFIIDIDAYLKKQLINKLMKLHMSYFVTGHTGKIGNRLFQDVEQVDEYFSGPFPEFVQNLILFIVSFIYLMKLNTVMTLIIVISFPLTMIFTKKIINPLFKSMSGFREKMDESLSLAKDSITGIDIIKAYSLQKFMIKKFNKIMDEAIAHFVNYEKFVAMSGPVKYIINSLPTFIYIIFALIQMSRGKVTSGELVAFTYLLRMISKPLSTFPTFVTNHVRTLVSFERYQEILYYEEESSGKVIDGNDCEKIFKCENMSFSYKNGKEILKDINLTIEKGKTIAFVGSSGCGKTTLFRLMTGQYKPTKGEIRFNGIDMRKINLNYLRENISYINQDSYLFPLTIRENIGFGQIEADFNQIEYAAKAAYAHDFISKFPNGYDTVLAEGAANLSGGQKQRLAIARGILKNAPIFMLDEMTSALDYETESYVQKSIDLLAKDKTVIIIAHRLSTIINADEIIVFDDGKIVEKGNHASLLQNKGLYCQLYEKQINEGE